jgi:hypothetical protein
MTVDDIKRLHYYERQFLRPRDFQDEQAYHLEMRRRHLLAHHTWGIVVGLEIEQNPNSKIWSVRPGMAVDGFGREILVFAPEPVDTDAIAALLEETTGPTKLKVWLAYHREKTNRPAPGYEVCGQPEQFTHVREGFRLIYRDKPATHDQSKPLPPQKELVDNPDLAPWPVFLGTITWNHADKKIGRVEDEDPRDQQRRIFIGAIAEEILAPRHKLLLRDPGKASPLPEGERGVSVKVEGALEIDRLLQVNQNLRIGVEPAPTLVLDNNQISARKEGEKFTLHLQANGGEIHVHQSQPDKKVVITDSGNVGIGTAAPNTKLHIDGGVDADLKKDSGFLVIGAMAGDNLVIDGNEIIARNANNSSPLYLQARGGDLSVHSQQNGTEFVIKDSGKVGIGLATPSARLHVRGQINVDADSLSDHVAAIENTSDGDNADVLALKVGRSKPGDGNNFVTFFGGDEAIGQIEGNGVLADGRGCVSYVTTGGDYAEYLPRLCEEETIQSGDIVGVFAGKVTKHTEGAHHVMIITSQPIVLGNMPDEKEKHLYEKVAFIGQVLTQARGPVGAGDYIVPSGENDGTGIAISPEKMTPTLYAQIVGRAWEASDQEGFKMINTVVGLPLHDAAAGIMAKLFAQQEEIKALLRSALENGHEFQKTK